MKRLMIFMAAACMVLVATAAPAVASSPMNVSAKSPSGAFLGKGQHYYVTKSTNTAKWVNTQMRWCCIDYTQHAPTVTVKFYIDAKGTAAWPASGFYTDTFTAGTVNAPGWKSVSPNYTSDKGYTWSWWSWSSGGWTGYAVTPTI